MRGEAANLCLIDPNVQKFNSRDIVVLLMNEPMCDNVTIQLVTKMKMIWYCKSEFWKLVSGVHNAATRKVITKGTNV